MFCTCNWDTTTNTTPHVKAVRDHLYGAEVSLASFKGVVLAKDMEIKENYDTFKAHIIVFGQKQFMSKLFKYKQKDQTDRFKKTVATYVANRKSQQHENPVSPPTLVSSAIASARNVCQQESHLVRKTASLIPVLAVLNKFIFVPIEIFLFDSKLYRNIIEQRRGAVFSWYMMCFELHPFYHVCVSHEQRLRTVYCIKHDTTSTTFSRTSRNNIVLSRQFVFKTTPPKKNDICKHRTLNMI